MHRNSIHTVEISINGNRLTVAVFNTLMLANWSVLI